MQRNIANLWLGACLLALLASCDTHTQENASHTASSPVDFEHKVERFGDLQILRYQVPGFDSLSLQQKKLAYYLYEAALSGRDIFWDQNYKHNLAVRHTLEGILNHQIPQDNAEDSAFLTYAKLVFGNNGLHHAQNRNKILPEFTEEYFKTLVQNTPEDHLPIAAFGSKDQLVSALWPAMADPAIDSKSVNTADGVDLLRTSATNLYENVSQAEASRFYQEIKDPNDDTPVMYGLNSKLVKKENEIREEVYKVGGLYTEAIERIVYWLNKAIGVAENDAQRVAIEELVKFYETGSLQQFDDYSIAWVADTNSVVDNVNGFIEVYDDPLGFKASWEAVVSIKDFEASRRMASLAHNAQWFETNSPIMDEHKKEKVAGVSYKVINVVVEAGRTAPGTPIGINLPNSDWIRAQHGSKSVSLGNIKNAYNQASSGGTVDEFYLKEDVKNRVREHSTLAGNIHTALHEVIGHASGQLEEGVANPSETLKNYSSAMEEARADLVSLYFITDQKLVDIGIIPTTEVGKAEYDTYITNGLQLQLRRLEAGANIEQAHMRNRQMISSWVYEHGRENNVIEKVVENGNTYFVINDYDKLRELFGQLLREVQRIKSQGDFEAAKNLIENYGVQADQDMMAEVKKRYEKMNAAPYSGFIQPRLYTVIEGDSIADVHIEYPEDFLEQMLYYGREYSFLPIYPQ
jgi:dipeptidyl-peptidase-3